MPRKPRRDNLEEMYDKGDHTADIQKQMDDCIRFFFKDKSYFCGGRVPECELLSEFSKQTLRTQFDDRCFDFLHERCLPLIPVDPEYNEPTVPWTVHCLLGLLNDLKKRDIPKEYQPGLLLLYFKFCKGVEILPPPVL